MRVLAIPAALAAAFHLTAASAEGADDAWQRSNYTLVEALNAGFTVVEAYHNNEGHLFFVLQQQNQLVLCKFEEVQAQKCLQLGTH